MIWLGYITKACKEKAEKHSVLEKVKIFSEDIKKRQQGCLALFNQFPPPYLVKKQFAGWEGRLIAERREITLKEIDARTHEEKEIEYCVIVFLDYMTRGNSKYDKSKQNGFGTDPVTYGNQHYRDLVQQEELIAYITEQQQKDPIPEPPEPSPYEWGYLGSALQRNIGTDGRFVFESIDWNKTINQEKHRPHWGEIYNSLGNFSAKKDIIQEELYSGTFGLIYFFSEQNILFLAEIGSIAEIENSKQKYTELQKKVSIATLSQYSCRAYPELILADFEQWSRIEDKNSGNMALSPEESDLLKNVETSIEQSSQNVNTKNQTNGAFPLFINGRAGSGKSTILQYLFTHYIEYYFTHGMGQGLPPLYLTYNDLLLEKAKENIHSFLRCTLHDDENISNIKKDDPVFLTAFYTFEKLLKEQLPPESQSFFAPARHIDYTRFEMLWKEKFSQEIDICKKGPELCWHIIRTFIKGCNCFEFLDIEEYCELSKEEKTVSPEDYEFVYSRVWENWYKPLTVKNTAEEDEPGEFWDDQDLIRYIIRNNYFSKRYPVVFCDEAQDFTRIELNLIMNLSIFSQRKIQKHQVGLLPFAFAGDPFQTLNPTGFRWEAVKNSFVEQFLRPFLAGDIPNLNYCELLNNYRSDANIVRFSNTIQQARSHILDIKIKPQNPWRESLGAQGNVLCCEQNNSKFWEWAENQHDLIFIVPCDPGEEKKYWEQSPLFQHLCFQDATVLSVITSKGLEYNNIAVCGFGQEKPDFFPLLNSPMRTKNRQGASAEIDSNNRLNIEYFFNKLYVAVSRAQHNLFILDSESAIQNFWSLFRTGSKWPFLAGTGENPMYMLLPNPEQEMFSEEREDEQSLRSQAERLENDGMQTRNFLLLDSAARLYKQSKSAPAKIQKCNAYSLRFQRKYLEAVKQGEYDTDYTFKHECWWLHGEESSLKKVYDSSNKNSDFRKRIEFNVLKNAYETSDIEGQIALLKKIYQNYTTRERELFEINCSTQAWRTIIGRIFAIICSNDLSAIQITEVWDNCLEFQKLGIAPDVEMLGKIAFHCKKYPETVEFLKKTQNKELESIRKDAEKLALPLDKRIQSCFSQKNWDEIRRIHHENQNENFSTQTLKQIAIAYADSGNTIFLEKIFRTNCSIEFYKTLKSYKFPKKVDDDIKEMFMCSAFTYCNSEIFREVVDKDDTSVSYSLEALIAALAHCDAHMLQKNIDDSLLSQMALFVKFAVEKRKKYCAEHFFEFGCAIEKTNRIKESKEFYKNASKFLFTKEERDLADKRLMICFYRHAEILTVEKERNFQLREAEKIRTRLGLEGVVIGSAELPEYLFGNDPWLIRLPKKEESAEKQSVQALFPASLNTMPTRSAMVESLKFPPPASLKTEGVNSESVASPLIEQETLEKDIEKTKVIEKADNVKLKESPEPLSLIAKKAGDSLAKIEGVQNKLFALAPETLTEYENNTSLLIEFCHQLISGIRDSSLYAKIPAANSFSQLAENLQLIELEAKKGKRKESFTKFVTDLLDVINSAELLPEYIDEDNQEDLKDFQIRCQEKWLEIQTLETIPECWDETLDAKVWFRRIAQSAQWKDFVAMLPLFASGEERRLFKAVAGIISVK